MQNIQSIQNAQITNSTIFKEDLIKSSLFKIKLFMRRHHTRKLLTGLSAEQLNDIGISRDQALEEALKPFWK